MDAKLNIGTTFKKSEDKSNLSYDEVFTKPIIKTGRWTLLLAIPLSFLPAIYLWLRYGAIPPVGAILTGWFLIASIFGPMFAMFAIKHPKFGIFALGMALFLVGIVKVLPVYLIIPTVVFSTIGFAVSSYKRSKKAAK